MRRQTSMQDFFIFLIMVVSINLNFSSLANSALALKNDNPPGHPSNQSSGQSRTSSMGNHTVTPSPPGSPLSTPPPGSPLSTPPPALPPPTPPPAPPPSHPPPPPSHPAPSPTHLPPPPSPEPPALTRASQPSPEPPANEMASQKKVGKFVGLLFLGIAGVLQVGVLSFLVFKRWQIPRIQDETGVRLVS